MKRIGLVYLLSLSLLSSCSTPARQPTERSLAEGEAAGAVGRVDDQRDLQALTPSHTEYTRVQTGDWLDDSRFVVGRWDGTLSVFRRPREGEHSPVVLAARVTTEGDGVEMAISPAHDFVLFSDTPQQLALWSLEESSVERFAYDPRYGISNAAISVVIGGDRAIVTGHSEGYVLIWSYDGKKLDLRHEVDARSPDPIQSPYPIKNIRGLAHWRDSLVVAGSEDGDLSVIDVREGLIKSRQRYNPAAQRGINNLSLSGDFLLVANCSVGPEDANLWLYLLAESSIKRLDSINLIADAERPQSFNFDADLERSGDSLRFYASTEEGLLWAGDVDQERLLVRRVTAVAADGGAFLDISADGRTLLAAARKLFLFDLG